MTTDPLLALLDEIEVKAKAATPEAWRMDTDADCHFLYAVNPDLVLRLVAVARAADEFVHYGVSNDLENAVDRLRAFASERRR